MGPNKLADDLLLREKKMENRRALKRKFYSLPREYPISLSSGASTKYKGEWSRASFVRESSAHSTCFSNWDLILTNSYHRLDLGLKAVRECALLNTGTK